MKFPNGHLKKFERRPLVYKLMYWYLFIFVAHIVILISYGLRIVKIIFKALGYKGLHSFVNDPFLKMCCLFCDKQITFVFRKQMNTKYITTTD